MNRIRALILMSLSFSAVTAEAKDPPQLLRHAETLSRDHFYLHFDENGRYSKQNIIGGEHQTAYHMLGFESDVFQVTVKSLEGEAMYSFSGEGFQHNSNSGEPNTEIVTVLYQYYGQPSTWVTIWLSAHPYAEYIITVDKL
ncbi:hypothetical protein [Psychromonas aquimarina]|uniref:hypothetical protein n=1 Tax=Psychromonas aquimarina TaxID=444919 RepID=UPI00041BB882|nr:hypothetical protein [Psychromonas aquimarina]